MPVCPYARAGIGAVLTQHRTDPALGPRGIDLLEAGRSALEAGEEAGGELKQVKSAALPVVHEHSFPLVDLRVELDRNPLTERRFLWEMYRPQVDLYVRRAVDPDSIPHPET